MPNARSWLLPLLLLCGCQFFAHENPLLADVSKAQAELTKTFGVNVSIKFKAEELESARHATVRFQKKPPGLTRVQIERDVNIVLHRYVPRVETIDLEVPD